MGPKWLAGQSFAFGVWGVALAVEAGVNRMPAIKAYAAEYICYLSQFALGFEGGLLPEAGQVEDA